MNDFWQRLKQRKLVQWALAYVAFAFALLQGIDIVAQRFDWPPAIERYLILALVIGFFVVLVLAWYHGERGRQRLGGTELLIIALLLAIGGALIWRFGPVTAQRTQATAKANVPTIAAQAIPAKSIAVLPFENLSNDKNNAYFVAGMQDLILTKLADIGDLKVIARTSTQSYGSHPQDLKTVGVQLGVATILEGSVQKQGNEVLINVSLINAQTAAHLWARAYTRTLTNVFGVEGEVATQIATSLNAKLSPAQAAQLAAAPSANQAAMDLFLRAEYLSHRANTNYATNPLSSFEAALPVYRQAVHTDPTFALAWARLSWAESHLAWAGGGGEDIGKLKAHARADAAKAMKLAPYLAAAQIAQGYVAYYGETDYPAALTAFAAALKLKPNDAPAWAALGYVQRRQGQFNTAIASLQQALSFDPRNSALACELGVTYMQVSGFAEAEQAFQRSLALDPHNLNAQTYYPSAILFASGDVAKALAAAQGDSVARKFIHATLLTYRRQYSEARALFDTIPDTPDNFAAVFGNSEAQQQADLHTLLGDFAGARALYAEDLPKARAAIDTTQEKAYQGEEWSRVADDELGLGRIAQGLADIARAQALVDEDKADAVDLDPAATEFNASLYAKARRPDLAVPLLARALEMPGIGLTYSPVLLWLDPAWDPIRHDPRFQALLKHYAQYKPAVTYDNPPFS